MTASPADGFATLSGTIQDSMAVTRRTLLEQTSTPIIDERNLQAGVAPELWFAPAGSGAIWSTDSRPITVAEEAVQVTVPALGSIAVVLDLH